MFLKKIKPEKFLKTRKKNTCVGVSFLIQLQAEKICKNVRIQKQLCWRLTFTTFLANVPSLCPLKTPENLFWCFQEA